MTKPIKGIMKTNEIGNAIYYQVACECNDPDDSHDIEVEASEDGITVTIYAKGVSEYHNLNLFDKTYDKPFGVGPILDFVNYIYRCGHIIISTLKNGYHETYTVTLLDNEAAKNYANTLLTAVDNVATLKENRNKGT